MTQVERFDVWLREHVHPVLRKAGFAKSGSTFHRRGPDGWSVINFQRSQFGTRDKVTFYVNVAVALDRLLVKDGIDPARKPPAHKSNWQARIERLAGPGTPTQWEVVGSTDLDRLTQEVVPLLERSAVPFIETRLTEAGFAAALTEARPADPIRPPASVILAELGAAHVSSGDAD